MGLRSKGGSNSCIITSFGEWGLWRKLSAVCAGIVSMSVRNLFAVMYWWLSSSMVSSVCATVWVAWVTGDWLMFTLGREGSYSKVQGLRKALIKSFRMNCTFISVG